MVIFMDLTEPWLYRRSDPLDQTSPIVPSSAGVPASGAADLVMVPWNDVEAFETAMREHGDESLPSFANRFTTMPAVSHRPRVFSNCCANERKSTGLCWFSTRCLSGFRTNLGGVSAQYGVVPDLTTHAKALANGMPLSSVSGRSDLMLMVTPTGGVAHSGTYSGHLLSVLAALATLEELSVPGVYDRLLATAHRFYADLQAVFDRVGLPAVVQGMGARFGFYFGRTEPVRTWSDALGHDHDMHQEFVRGCLARGVSIHGYTRQGPPGHAGFSFAHSDEDFAEILAVVEAVSAEMASSR